MYGYTINNLPIYSAQTNTNTLTHTHTHSHTPPTIHQHSLTHAHTPIYLLLGPAGFCDGTDEGRVGNVLGPVVDWLVSVSVFVCGSIYIVTLV